MIAVANPGRIFTEDEKQILLREYVNNKKSLQYCSKILNIDPRTVKKQLVNMNIRVRNRQEALALVLGKEDNRKYPANDSYFSTPNEKMAYMLGFIAADGNVPKVGNDLRISLALVDKDFLEIIHNEIGGRPIREYQSSNGHNFCAWSCASRQIREDLANYNIIPNKTFLLDFPTNLPRQYWKDFIRGYFDGDGCFSGSVIQDKGKPNPRVRM